MQDDYLFEWDEQKSLSNKRKHGLSFEEAKSIWDDPWFAEIHLISEPEDRWAVIGCIARGVYLTAIITYRNDTVRIISARKATKKEIDIYESN